MEVCNPLIGLTLSKLVNHLKVILLNLCNLLKAFLNQRIKMLIILDQLCNALLDIKKLDNARGIVNMM